MDCPECRTGLPKDSNFCYKCGHEIDQKGQSSKPIAVSESERKRVTALFSDLTGYTSMTEKLDPEEVKEITNNIFNGIRGIVKKYEGFIEKFAGDGVLVLFGVPKAHEDDPIRAIYAAKDIKRYVESISPRYEAKIGNALSMHSGINTGLSVIADVNTEKGTHGVTGEAINVAARLSDIAVAGEMIVGLETYRATKHHFNFEVLTPVKVKGKSEAIPIYKLISPKNAVTSTGAERQIFSEMVGRDKELDRLELQVLKAVNGEGSVVDVIGEAGIGKSRLIAELKNREVMKRVSLLEGRANSIGKNLSFHPIIDLLKQWAGIGGDDSEIVAFDKLDKAVRAVSYDTADEILPFVATLMSMNLIGKHAERVKGIEGEPLEKLIVKNIRELIIKGSEIKPTIIIVEDLHWADASSIELLEILYRSADTHRLVFINVFRPGYLEGEDRKITAFRQKLPDYYVRIEIKPLESIDSENLIKNMLSIQGLPYLVKEQILDRAGGNPFFIEEVVRSLIDDGAVVRQGDGFEITKKIKNVVIPATINDVLMSRLDRLEAQTRALVRIASVVGRSFFDRIIKDVADSIASLDERLQHLKDIQLIRDRVRMQELEYLFKHALAQEAAYESTLKQQRRTLHLKVANSIEKVFRDRLQEFYGMLAFHYSMSKDEEKTEEYLIKAGEEALKSSASSEAIEYCQKALELYTKKYEGRVDPGKMAQLEGNIALAFYNKGYHAQSVEYFTKTLNNLGYKEPKNKLNDYIKLILNIISILANLYLPSIRKKKIPNDLDSQIMDFALKRNNALSLVDLTRCFIDTMEAIKQAFKFDLSRSQPHFNELLWGAGIFMFSGISYNISKKIIAYVQKDISDKQLEFSPWYIEVFRVAEPYFSVSWYDAEYNENAIDEGLKSGDIWNVLNILFFYGLIHAELGNFANTQMALDKMHTLKQEFYDENIEIYFHNLITWFMIKRRVVNIDLKEVTNTISIMNKIGQKSLVLRFLGFKIYAEVMQNKLEDAQLTLEKAEYLIAELKLRNIPPLFYYGYLLGAIFFEITKLEHAIMTFGIGEQNLISENGKTIFSLSKKIAKISKKHRFFNVEAYRLIGKYYWLINKQKSALKWFEESIKEGERLRARPELARTYFEVGRRLFEPKSNFKLLNGIKSEVYLDRARIMFGEMDLQWDLDKIQKFN